MSEMNAQGMKEINLERQTGVHCTTCKAEVDNTCSSCEDLDQIVKRSLLMCLNICKTPEELDELSKKPLPLCMRCRDKVVLLTSNWQLFMQSRELYEEVRHDLAFAVIDSYTSEPENSPSSQIRSIILEKWMPLYNKAKNEEGDSKK